MKASSSTLENVSNPLSFLTAITLALGDIMMSGRSLFVKYVVIDKIMNNTPKSLNLCLNRQINSPASMKNVSEIPGRAGINRDEFGKLAIYSAILLIALMDKSTIVSGNSASHKGSNM